MKKRCKWTKKMNAYLDGELNAEQTVAIHDHLEICDTCQEKLQELKAVNSFLGEYSPSTAPSYLQQKIVAHAQDINIKETKTIAKLPIAASALAAFVLGFIFSTQTFTSNDNTQISLGNDTLYSYLEGVEK